MKSEKKTIGKRSLAFFLVMLMLLNNISLNVYATELGSVSENGTAVIQNNEMVSENDITVMQSLENESKEDESSYSDLVNVSEEDTNSEQTSESVSENATNTNNSEIVSENTTYEVNVTNVEEYEELDVAAESTLFASGEGTEESPYLITTAEELLELTTLGQTQEITGYFRLENDIVLTAASWMPIGSDYYFSGTFDGNGYTISGLKLPGIESAGLFGFNKGTIKNLMVDGIVTDGLNYVGILCAVNKGTIENCHTSGTIDSNETRGGLAGYNSGTITGSSSDATVKGGGTSSDYVGGLVGHNECGTIRLSHADGSVTGYRYVGGLVGYNYSEYNTNDSVIEYSYATGTVTATESYAGGLVGRNDYYNDNYGKGRIRYSYAKGNVKGVSYVGGLAGCNESSISYSYAVGVVTATSYNGGLQGSTGGSIGYSYYNAANTGNKSGFRASLAKMKQQSTYYGWDFEHIWAISADENGGYPYIDLREGEKILDITGSGSEDDPYVITKEEHLIAMMTGKLGTTNKQCYVLGNDVILTTDYWGMIWDFNGSFDGAGYTISGLKSSLTNYSRVGLFGNNSGTIKNLTVEGDVSDGGGYIGILCAVNSGTIENCHTSGTVNSDETRGGLAGYNSGTITGSSSDVTVKGGGTSSDYVGGLVGHNECGTIRLSHADGSVTGYRYVGGLVGYNYSEYNTNDSVIEYSYATGTVTATESYAGGLVGRNDYYNDNYGKGRIRYSYAKGNVKGVSYVGGLAGYNESSISYSYAVGVVTATSYNGGLQGSTGGSIGYSYYNAANTANKSGYRTPLAKMKQQSTYYGWDFDHVWYISADENGGYPYINLREGEKILGIEGSGTEDDPYVIATEEQLFALRTDELNSMSKEYYVLGNDIVLTNENWGAIWDFNGTFDGAGHTISGLKSSYTSFTYVGLFGYNTGTIKNLNVEGTLSDGGQYVGILCAHNAGNIENCHTSGSITSDKIRGGLVGYNTGTIITSNSDVTVTGAGDYAGGLAGKNDNSISQCFAQGKVSGNYYVGGLVGYSGESTSTITNSYATASVSGTSYVGGLLGRNYNSAAVNCCYATGNVSASNYFGGLIGSNAGIMQISYYCSTTTGCNDTNKGVALSKSQMKDAINFDGFDFTQMWGTYSNINNGYPFLLCDADEFVEKNDNFWYEVKETKKGYASCNQTMKIYVAEEKDKTVQIQLTYKGAVGNRITNVSTVYDEEKQAFVGEFVIEEGIQEITELAAIVSLDSENYEMSFIPSFWYQLPLKVEGVINIKLNEETVETDKMSLKLFNADNQCVFKKAIDGEKELTVKSLVTGKYDLVLYGNGMEFARLDNIEVTQGSSVTADLTTIPALANLEVEFYVDDMPIADIGVKAIFVDKTEDKNRLFKKGTKLTYLAEGDTIGYSLYLNDAAAKLYKVNNTVYKTILKAGDNKVKLELERFQNVNLKEMIVEKDTETPVTGAKVTAVQKLNGIHTNSMAVISDELGQAELEMYDEETSFTISKTGYATVTYTVSANALSNQKFVLEKAQNRVQFSINYVKSYLETSMVTNNDYNLIPDKIAIFNQTTGQQITGVQNDWPNLYVSSSQVSAGDTLGFTLEKSGYATTTIDAVVLATGNVKVSGTIYQLGGIQVTLNRDDGLAGMNNQIAIYGSDGNRVSYKNGIASMYTLRDLQAGDYTVVIADKSAALVGYSTLAKLQEDTELAEKYDLAVVEVADGTISVMDTLSVPADVSFVASVEEAESGVTLSKTNAMIGDTITLRAQVTLNDKKEIGNTELLLNIPDGVNLVDATVNDETVALEIIDGVIMIPMSSNTTIVRCRVKIMSTVTTGVLNFGAKFSYEEAGVKYAENIGKAELQLNELTVIVPEKTNSMAIVARGAAKRDTEIEIYDGDILVGKTTANKYGAYRVEIALVDRGTDIVHRIKAVNAQSKAESAIKEVVYGERDIYVTEFSMIHNGRTYNVLNPNIEISALNLTMIPSEQFEFIVKFSDNTAVGLVSTDIQLTNGNIEIVDMYYNDVMDYWEGVVTLDSSRVPNGCSVSYIPTKYYYVPSNEDELASVFEGSTSEVLTVQGEGTQEPVEMEEKIVLDDAENTVLYAMESIQENVSFVPNDSYIKGTWNGQTYYFNPLPVFMTNAGKSYWAVEVYFEQTDGTYTMWRRGVGQDESSNAVEQLASSAVSMFGLGEMFEKAFDFLMDQDEYTKEINGRMKEVKEAIKKLNSQTNAVNKAKELSDISQTAERVEEYLEIIVKNGGSKAKTKASSYITEIKIYKMVDSATSSFDLIKYIIRYSNSFDTYSRSEINAFNKIFSKGQSRINEQEEEVVESMKGMAEQSYMSNFQELLQRILSDPDIANALKELENEKKSGANSETTTSSGSNDNSNSELDNKASKNKKVATVKTSVDPSGYVYETFEDNRLSGVTATLYYENADGDMQIWEAEEFEQSNPLITDNGGNYAWDVPEGLWQVVYEKDGYEKAMSDKLVVPPPQLDVNIAMVSNKPAQVSNVSHENDKIIITFDKYLKVDTVLKDSVQLMKGETIYDVELNVNQKDIREYENDSVVKKLEVKLKEGFLEEGNYEIVLNGGIQTYAGVSMEKIETSYILTNASKAITVTIPDGVNVYLDEIQLIASETLYQNDRIKIVANPPEGKRLKAIKVNDMKIDNESFYIIGTEDVVITVEFIDADIQTATVSFNSAGGVLVESQVVEIGEVVTEPAVPERQGYKFLGWYLGDSVFDFTTEIFEDIELTAKWEEEVIFEQEFTIEASAGEGGTISPIDKVTVKEGRNQKFIFTPDEGYKIKEVLVDGESQGAISGYTFETVAENHSIQVIFVQVVTVSFNSTGGSFVESQSIIAGEQVTEPEMPQREGYKFLGWYLGDGAFDFTTEVEKDIELTAKWEEIVVDNEEFTIRASAGEGGTISPVNEVVVKKGDSQKFVFTPDVGYEIEDVLVDGASIGVVASYTFDDVTDNRKIEVYFTKNESVKVQSITLSQNSITTKKGNVLQLEAQVLPENAEDRSIKWTSSDTTIAVVTNGIVATIGVGEVVITAESQDGSGVTASCQLRVMEEESNQPDDSGNSEDNEDTKDDETTEDENTKDDANAGGTNNKNDVNSSESGSKTDVIPDDNNSNKEPVAQNPDASQKSDVKVIKLEIIAPSKKLAAGKKVKLSVGVLPADATNKAVLWKTSNTKYASIDQNGKLTLKKAGAGKSITITASAADGSGVVAKIRIEIMKNAVKSIKLKAAKKSVKAGKSLTIKTTVKTTGKSVNKTLKWTSSNTQYATVKNGKVKTKKAGKGKKVTITATSTDGSNKKTKIKITIK